MIKKLLLITAATFFLWSCNDDFEPNVDDAVISQGDADFTKFVAVGNSLTAGYADGALYSSGQTNSYPNIMANVMASAGGGSFTQPLMPDDIGGFANLGVQGKFQLQVVGTQILPVQTPASGDLTMVNGLYSNCGVPGAKSYHLLYNGYGNPANLSLGLANPYFVRMASSPTATVVGDAMAQSPTFFSLWIGNNDVLGYATNGGDATIDQITNSTDFQNAYGYIVQTLTSGGAKGVVANLPYVTSIPFFNTIPYNPITPTDLGGEAGVNQLNATLYGPLVQLLTAIGAQDRIALLSSTENNPLLIEDENLQDLGPAITYAAANSGNPALAALAPILGAQFGKARLANNQDLICLTSSSVLGKPDAARVAQLMALGLDEVSAGNLSVGGVTYPLKDRWVLTASEVAECTNATDGFNNVISNIADVYDLALFDAKAAMESLSSNSGLVYNGVSYNATFVTGGAFSLDGVHPNARGYAIIANGFLQAINSKYHSTLPMVNPNDYPGVVFPN